MARPRMAAQERRSETLAVRLTPEERVRIEQAALAAGLSTSEYARAQLLTGRVVIRQNRTLDHAVFDELRRIGVNLNQLTRLAHQRQGFPAGLTAACDALEHILTAEFDWDAGPADGANEPESEDGHPSGYGPITVRFDPSIDPDSGP